MKAKIKKFVIRLGKKEIELSPKEAEKLHSELDEIYGDNTKEMIQYVPHTYPVIFDRPYPYWYYDRLQYTNADGVQWSYTTENQYITMSL